MVSVLFTIFVFTVIVCLICGFITGKIAVKRGRKEPLAFWLGFFFGIWAMIGYLVAGETEELKVERLKKVMNK